MGVGVQLAFTLPREGASKQLQWRIVVICELNDAAGCAPDLVYLYLLRIPGRRISDLEHTRNSGRKWLRLDLGNVMNI